MADQPTVWRVRRLRRGRDFLARLSAAARRPGFFLLHSGQGGGWSLAGIRPAATLELRRGRVVVQADGRRRPLEGDPLDLVEAWTRRWSGPIPRLPLAPGAFLALGYHYPGVVDPAPPARGRPRLPDLVAVFHDRFVLHQPRSGRTLLVSADGGGELPPARPGPRAERWPRIASPRSNLSWPRYRRAVDRIRQEILAGRVYQVNLARRFGARAGGPAFGLFRRLCAVSPAEYSAFYNAGSWQLLSSSPECFLRLRRRRVESRPIKGTRPRAAEPEQDRRMRAELLASAKERAELLMITDLVRNDLGRVCGYGSVVVARPRVITALANVWHSYAVVRGRLRPQVGRAELLRAAFPPGSVTGAPKPAAIALIAELEPSARTLYCGAVGRFGYDGGLDLSVAIRILVRQGSRAWYWSGGGVVADSEPATEFHETLHKARGLRLALGGEVP